jgi:phytoene synthase
MPVIPNELAASNAYCHAQTRKHAKSFYFASIALPDRKKAAAFAIYAYCRYADDLVDESGIEGKDLDTALAQLDADFDLLIATNGAGHPFGPAFAHTVTTYEIPKALFLDLIKGVRMDRGHVRIPNWPALREYCYHVASVVGLILCRIFELRDPRGEAYAIDLGIAMQLTNIIRDVGEDLDNDRIYLPLDELAAHSLDESVLRRKAVTAEFRSFLKDQIARARSLYAASEEGIPLLADDGSQRTVWMMRVIYAGILDEVERAGYDVLNRRVSTSTARKIRLALRAAMRHRASRRRSR